MKIMFIGDIFGKVGRKAVIENVASIKKTEKIDFVIANAENTSHGRSLTSDNYQQLLNAGIDVFTMGNHTWDIKTIYSLLDKSSNIIRPLNVVEGSKEALMGLGTNVFNVKNLKIRVTNLVSQQCKTKNANVTNPFICFANLLKQIKKDDIHIVDFHAETTSEKKAFLLTFVNQVSLIVGTHTHVQTSDYQIYKNTAFITDLGMCGAKESIIGAKPKEIIEMFNNKRTKFHLEPAKGNYQFNSIIIEFNLVNKTYIPIDIKPYNINNN